MEEEINYVTVTFKSKSVSADEKSNCLEIIYDEVNTGGQPTDTNPVNPVPPDIKAKAPMWSLLHLVAAVLGLACVILMSVVIGFSSYFNSAVSEQNVLNAQNLQLKTEKDALKEQMEGLTKEKDGLVWTIGVILEYDNFPVTNHCPKKVCKPCLDGWRQFQSKCYLFNEAEYYRNWLTWQQSQDDCRGMNSDLVVIESQQEQFFINKHIKFYDDDRHGYWIGLKKLNQMSPWMWVDGSNLTTAFWKTKASGYTMSCALTLDKAEPSAKWVKESCFMKNRWICERKALITD